jgi:uncharacterized integral membrane protein (TIGR00698 family)
VSRRAYLVVAVVTAAALVGLDAPSWAALASGLAIALVSGASPPAQTKRLTTLTLQLGVVALGAGMNLEVVWRVGSSGAVLTAAELAAALAIGVGLGKLLRVPGDTALLVAVGTAICGGSAIAAVASVIRPKPHEMSVALAVVFVLNAIGLLVFPPLGHAIGLDEPQFGRWAALAIHDTSSVVGAGLAYGKVALDVATTTKLARALWIVPLTIAIAAARRGDGTGSLRDVKWPWFIAGFVAVAALATWVPELADAAHVVKLIGTRLLVLALFLIGLSLSRAALATVGLRPAVLGVALWLVIATAALVVASSG